MLISRASVQARVLVTAAVAAVLGGLLLIPAASAVEAPGASVFAIQTNGPNGLVTLGDWYSSNAVGAGNGYHYIRFTVPCGWPAGLPISVDLFSPEMNRVSGALARSEEPNGAYDSTQFELYGPGVTVGPGYASPRGGDGHPRHPHDIPAGAGGGTGDVEALLDACGAGGVRQLRGAIPGVDHRSAEPRRHGR